MSSDATSINSQDNIKSLKICDAIIYEFEDFRLDVAHRMLYRRCEPISLAPKVIETLIVLIENRGEIISKDELMSRIWTDSFVEESNLTQNIYLLRKTLGTDSEGKNLIETFRRRGYRFTGTLKNLKKNGIAAGQAREDAAEEEPEVYRNWQHEAERTSTAKISLPVIAAFGALLVSALTFAGFYFYRFERAESSPAVTLRRLTPDIYAYNPAVSPDGRLLAYSEIRGGKSSVWLKDIALGSAVQLLPPVVKGYKGLRFSNDGKQLYFLTVREDAPNHVVARVSLADKTVTELADNAISPVAVSPDESRLAFINGAGELVIAGTNQTPARVLRRRENGKWFNGWDAEMSFSPDGERIVVCGGYLESGKSFSELLEIAVADGSERRLSTPKNWHGIGGAIWLADGKQLLVTARESLGQPSQIWKISYPDGAARRLTSDLNDYEYISAAADGKTIVAEQMLGNLNIWTADTENTGESKQLTFGRAAKDGFYGMAVLPDGKIVFTSLRGGGIDIWLAEDGAEQRQLTAGGAVAWSSRPQASADGRFIVYSSSRAGGSQIFRMDADGGNPQQLTYGERLASRPAVSPDSKWVYYTSGEGSDESVIWKVPIAGGEPLRVSKHSLAWGASPSPDGRLVAYNHNLIGDPRPWRVAVMNAADGEPLRLFDLPVFGGILGWTGDSKSILYINGETPNIWQQPVAGGDPKPFTQFAGDRILYFGFSPDHKQMAFSRGNMTTEAVMITDTQ